MKRGLQVVVTVLLTLCGMWGFACFLTPQIQAEAAAALQPEKEQTQLEENALEFPFVITGTTLEARALAAYEGDNLEWDSREHIVDVAALEVYNFGSEMVELAQIMLSVQGESLEFWGTNLPAGETMLIVERNSAPWTDAPCTGCSGWAQYVPAGQVFQMGLQIREVDMGTLEVTNTTDVPMTDIWIYYKNYLPEGDVYLGGITYTQHIASLDAGRKCLLTPYRYAGEYSRIIRTQILE